MRHTLRAAFITLLLARSVVVLAGCAACWT
jgi:hypothetical protein